MAAPVNTVPPAITGTAEIGNRLECSTGTWTGGVQSFAFQWIRVNANDGPIAGATQQYYIVSADDCRNALKCIVTASNNQGATSAESNTTDIVPDDWLEVEDGTGKDDAVSYASRAYASDYHARRNNRTWLDLTCGQRNAALVLATDFIEAEFGQRFKGARVSMDQALSWPRSEVILNGFDFPDDEVPKQVRDACAEMALKAVEANLVPDISNRGNVLSERVEGAVAVTYSDSGPLIPVYQVANKMLAGLLEGGGMYQFRAVRG